MAYITDIYLPLCNSENGDLNGLPFSGSLMDQPYMTMQVLLLIQSDYKKMLSEKMEKMRTKSTRRRSR